MNKHLLLKLAKNSIREGLGLTVLHTNNLIQDNPAFLLKKSVFVTLYVNEELRGCIGSFDTHISIYHSIIENSKSAAFSDDRFKSISETDLPNLKIEISILEKPVPFIYSSYNQLLEKLSDSNLGVILHSGSSRTTYLPEVWNSFPDPEIFLNNLQSKAGLDDFFIKDTLPLIEVYSVTKISDNRRRMKYSGKFYDSDPIILKKQIDSFEYNPINSHIRAIIVPHASLCFSGNTANKVFSQLANYKRIFIIGPSHNLFLDKPSIRISDSACTPFGPLSFDIDYSLYLKDKFDLGVLTSEPEHSTEVQLPFIKHYLPDSKIVEILYSDSNLAILASIFQELSIHSDDLIVISTDLSHFHNKKIASSLDSNCIHAIKSNDLESISTSEACGKFGILSLLSLDLFSVDNVFYSDSSSLNNDFDSVVGYLSATFLNK